MLDLRGNSFQCPFPVFPHHVLWLSSECTYPTREYAIYAGIVTAVLCVGAMVYQM